MHPTADSHVPLLSSLRPCKRTVVPGCTAYGLGTRVRHILEHCSESRRGPFDLQLVGVHTPATSQVFLCPCTHISPPSVRLFLGCGFTVVVVVVSLLRPCFLNRCCHLAQHPVPVSV